MGKKPQVEMKVKYITFNLLFSLCITLYVQAVSLPSPEEPACRLNFSRFPYQPTEGCSDVQERIDDGNGFPRTRCCQNALFAFAHALALQAIDSTQGNIFIPEEQWNNCNRPFKRQLSVSAQTCAFDDLYYGSSHCSNLQLSYVKQAPYYPDIMNQCSQFSPSFDDACNNCNLAILSARDNLLYQLNVKENGIEKSVCFIAIIISITAGMTDDFSTINDFYQCLPALASSETVNYIKIKDTLAVAVFSIFVLIALILLIMLITYIIKNRKHMKRPVRCKQSDAMCSGLYRFSKDEIKNAIDLDNGRKCLGRGRTGQVYLGMLPSGQLVAIKQIHVRNTPDYFTQVIRDISKVRHCNLVSLLGYCIEGHEKYLVYDYCSAGNLAQNLLRKDTVLTWERRVKILRNCALALGYLHNQVDGFMVHRNIKLSNILLTADLEPKLSDFGLENLKGWKGEEITIRGDFHIMDPEYMNTGKVICASDMYCFGIVILQVLSGQRVIELDLEARDQLTRKAKDVNQGKRPLTDFQDPRLNGKVNGVDFESILQVAVLCVASSSRGRPTIDLVCDELDKAWLNTMAEMRKKEITAQYSCSLEVTPV